MNFDIDAEEIYDSLNLKMHFVEWFHNKLASLDLKLNEDYVVEGSQYLINEATAAMLLFSTPNSRNHEEKRQWINNSLACRDIVSKIAELEIPPRAGGSFQMSDGVVVISSRTIAEVTGKKHLHVLRDIKKAREDTETMLTDPNLDPLNVKSLQSFLEGVKEDSYLDAKGEARIQLILNERAALVMFAKYSHGVRCRLVEELYKQREFIDAYCKKHIAYTSLLSTIKQPKAGYVYVLRGTHSGRVKIGISVDVSQRLTAINVGSELATVEYVTPLCTNFRQIENAAHEFFKDHCVHPEWFDVSVKQAVAYLESIQLAVEPDMPD